MAKLRKDPAGKNRFILEWYKDGKRERVRLCKTSVRDAEATRRHVAFLLSAQLNLEPPPEDTQLWLGKIGAKLRAKFEKHRLLTPEKRGQIKTLGELADTYCGQLSRRAKKPNTRADDRRKISWLFEYFDQSTSIDAVTRAQAIEYQAWLQASREDGGRGLSKASANGACGCGNKLFAYAINERLLTENPFRVTNRASVKSENEEPSPAEDCSRIMAALPNDEWRLMWALARWGGLRTPSEQSELQWQDVSLGVGDTLGSMQVYAPKTDTTRTVPIWKELEPLITKLHANLPANTPGETLVFPTLAGKSVDYAFRRAAKRARVELWGDITRTMRRTRATELMHATNGNAEMVSKWTGHTVATLRKFYWKPTAEMQAEVAARAQAELSKSGQESGPHSRAWRGTEPQVKTESNGEACITRHDRV